LSTETSQPEQPATKKSGTLGRVIFALITLLCFAYLYYRLNGAAMREGLTLTAYMAQVFATVEWGMWLLIMVGYSLFYFAIDTLVVSRALSWFITDIRYRDILPVRASAYIVSLFNEQVGKGGMAWYLHRRHQVPGWEGGLGDVVYYVL
jgi:hypothetical protein